MGHFWTFFWGCVVFDVGHREYKPSRYPLVQAARMAGFSVSSTSLRIRFAEWWLVMPLSGPLPHDAAWLAHDSTCSARSFGVCGMYGCCVMFVFLTFGYVFG